MVLIKLILLGKKLKDPENGKYIILGESIKAFSSQISVYLSLRLEIYLERFNQPLYLMLPEFEIISASILYFYTLWNSNISYLLLSCQFCFSKVIAKEVEVEVDRVLEEDQGVMVEASLDQDPVQANP